MTIKYSESLNSTKEITKDNQKNTDKYLELVLRNARKEILRLGTIFDIDMSYFQLLIDKYTELRGKIKRGRPDRVPEVLIPVLVYHFLKEHNQPVTVQKIIPVINCNKKKFVTSLKRTWHLFKKREPDRNTLTLSLIGDIAKKMNLSVLIKKRAEKIFSRNSSVINSTTNGVAAATSIYLSAAFTNLNKDISIKKITNYVSGSCSAISYRIRMVLKQRDIFSGDRLKNFIPSFNMFQKLIFKNMKKKF
ncbi:MAG: hypothetical protein ACTSWY_06910 [Promethearchaeota archaeon]